MYIEGDKKEIQKFKEFASSEELDEETGKKIKRLLDMSKFIPYPQKFKDVDIRNKEYYENINRVKNKLKNKEKLTKEEEKIVNKLALIELESKNLDYRKDGYNSGGYEWCCSNWGTKWNFGDVDLEEEKEDYLKYQFQTAWAVPMPVLFKMSKMFPDLTFEYSGNEESEAFEVEYKFKKGKITEKEEKDWKDIQIEKRRI